LAFDDAAVGEFDVVNREAAQVGDFFYRAFCPKIPSKGEIFPLNPPSFLPS